MKKEYKDLELEVVDFTAEDVITASAPGCEKDCAPDKVPCDPMCKCTGEYECKYV